MMIDNKEIRDKINNLTADFREQDRQQLIADYGELLKLPSFRRVFCALLKRTRVFGSIAMDSVDTNYVMKLIGMREMGVEVYCTGNIANGELVMKAILERNEIEQSRTKQILQLQKQMKSK